jgi:hypothetical protein
MINITYIYLIENIDNDPYKVYIGKSKSIDSRKYNHKTTYGNNITFTIIEEILSVSKHKWKPLESYWIEQFRYWGFKVMNKNKGGGGIEFRTEECLNRIIEKLHKPIIQYDMDLNYIKTWKSIKYAVTETKITNIPNCLQHKNKSAGGYIWKYDNDTDFSYNISEHKSKNTPKPKGFGIKPKGFGDKVSKSLQLHYNKI